MTESPNFHNSAEVPLSLERISDRIGTCRLSGWARDVPHYEQKSCLDFTESVDGVVDV